MIKIKNLNKTYKSRKTSHHALRDINLDFADTGLNFLLGKSGSGKTTLMNMIGGLDKFDSGDIIIKHLSLSKASNSSKDRLRNTVIGFIFQDFNLIEHMTVNENVSVSLKLLGNYSPDEANKRVKKVLTDVGLGEYGKRKINELSGGQKQRVAIARALIKEPDILLCDEPTGNLDDDTSNSIFELLKEISRTKLVIVVSHNDKLAYHYGDRVINLLDGQVIKDELTSKSSKKTTKNLAYNGEYDSKVVAKEVLNNIGDNTIVHANILNSRNDSASEEGVVKARKYDTKDISMFRVLFKTGFGYFTLRKVRLVILTILMSFSLTIGAYMIGMYTYNGKADTISYLEQYDYPLHELNCERRNWELRCDYSLYTEYLLDSNLGEEAIAYLGNGTVDEALDIDVPDLYNSSNTVYGATNIVKILVNPSANLTEYFDLADGSTNIVSNNDIYITDRIAFLLNPLASPESFIGTTLDSAEDTFTIKGVILTDFAEKDFDSLTWAEESGASNKYHVIIYNKNYVDNRVAGIEEIDGSDIYLTFTETPNHYVGFHNGNVGKVSNHIGVDTSLLAGRAPEGLNEIVISRENMCNMMWYLLDDNTCNRGIEGDIIAAFESYLGKTIGDTFASDSHAKSAAFHSTFGTSIEIVGIMEDVSTADSYVGFLVSDEGMDSYASNISTSGRKYVLLDDSEYKYFTDYLYNATNSDNVVGEGYILSFYADDPYSFIMISDLSNTTVFPIMVLVVTLIFTIVSTVISNFNLNFIAEHKKKEIGIFKAQGYRNRSLYMLFIIVVALQTILIVTISTILTSMAMNLINSLSAGDGYMLFDNYKLITFGIEEFLYLFTCTFIFGMISLFKPLKKMATTEPIDVIKNL